MWKDETRASDRDRTNRGRVEGRHHCNLNFRSKESRVSVRNLSSSDEEESRSFMHVVVRQRSRIVLFVAKDYHRSVSFREKLDICFVNQGVETENGFLRCVFYRLFVGHLT